MKTQPILNIDGYSLFIQYFANNLYHLNIVAPDDYVHHIEGVYSSPQAAIERGRSVIDNLIFWQETKPSKVN